MTKEDAIFHLINKFPVEQKVSRTDFTDSLALQTLDITLPLEDEKNPTKKQAQYMDINLKISHDFMVHHYGIDIEPFIQITSQLTKVIGEFFNPYLASDEPQVELNQGIEFVVRDLDSVMKAIASYWITYTLQNWHSLKFFRTKQEEEIFGAIEGNVETIAKNPKYKDSLRKIKIDYLNDVNKAKKLHDERMLSLYSLILKENETDE